MSTVPSAPPEAHRHQDALDRLVALGTDLAELVVDQAKTGALAAAEAAKAFDRVARSVRRTVLLARKLIEPLRATNRVAARKRIIRAVEDHIQRFTEDEDSESLQQELLDRLDTPDFEDELVECPAEDIITDILRDFGLAALPGTHPWKRRTPGDVAELAAYARQPALPAERRHTPLPAATPQPARPSDDDEAQPVLNVMVGQDRASMAHPTAPPLRR